MESSDETNTFISESSDDTIDLRSLVTANTSPSSLSIPDQPSSKAFPFDQDQSSSSQYRSPSLSLTRPPSPQFAGMASGSISNVPESSPNFSLNAYASVTKLETGTFNDWKLRLTTVMGAHRLFQYILREVEAPIDLQALDDHKTNLMRALAAIHATINSENFEVVRHFANPREAFMNLCKHHDDAGGLSTANLFSDLVTLRLSSDGDLKDHIHRFRKI